MVDNMGERIERRYFLNVGTKQITILAEGTRIEVVSPNGKRFPAVFIGESKFVSEFENAKKYFLQRKEQIGSQPLIQWLQQNITSRNGITLGKKDFHIKINIEKDLIGKSLFFLKYNLISELGDFNGEFNAKEHFACLDHTDIIDQVIADPSTTEKPAISPDKTMYAKTSSDKIFLIHRRKGYYYLEQEGKLRLIVLLGRRIPYTQILTTQKKEQDELTKRMVHINTYLENNDYFIRYPEIKFERFVNTFIYYLVPKLTDNSEEHYELILRQLILNENGVLTKKTINNYFGYLHHFNEVITSITEDNPKTKDSTRWSMDTIGEGLHPTLARVAESGETRIQGNLIAPSELKGEIDNLSSGSRQPVNLRRSVTPTPPNGTPVSPYKRTITPPMGTSTVKTWLPKGSILYHIADTTGRKYPIVFIDNALTSTNIPQGNKWFVYCEEEKQLLPVQLLLTSELPLDKLLNPQNVSEANKMDAQFYDSFNFKSVTFIGKFLNAFSKKFQTPTLQWKDIKSITDFKNRIIIYGSEMELTGNYQRLRTPEGKLASFRDTPTLSKLRYYFSKTTPYSSRNIKPLYITAKINDLK